MVGVLDTIKHNLSEMTLTTETIKTQVSGEAWMKQRRAEIKWECYSKLAEDLGCRTVLVRSRSEIVMDCRN